MGNLRLYMAPGSCSTAVHILLEEIGEVFEAHIVNIPRGENRRPDYLAINPRGTIPALLRRDGSALTELLAIVTWLGQSYPKAGLWFADAAEEARAQTIMRHVAVTTHGEGFARVFTANGFGSDPADRPEVIATGRRIASDSFDWLAAAIAPEGYAMGGYSAVDPVLFYVEFWADKTAIPLPQRLARHYALMLNRPVVRRVLREEGYALDRLGLAPAAGSGPARP